MRFSNVAIEGVAHVLPAEVVTSAQLEAAFADTLRRLGMPPGQVEKLSGVRERRYWEPGTQPSVVSTMAAEKVLAQVGMRPDQVQCLINASVSRDFLEPATAALVAGQLGLSHSCVSFDITNACVGFVNGMHLLASLIELGQVDNGVVVCAENVRDGVLATLSRLAAADATMQTFRDNFATLTLGCGAVAMVMSRADRSRTTHRFHGGIIRTAPEHSRLCLGAYHEMVADAHGLLVHGVGLAVETWPYAVPELGFAPRQIDHFICHQVSIAHFQQVLATIDQPLDRVILTLPFLGNCGPASLPLTLSLADAQGQLKSGDKLCLYAVGSGLSCAIFGATW